MFKNISAEQKTGGGEEMRDELNEMEERRLPSLQWNSLVVTERSHTQTPRDCYYTELCSFAVPQWWACTTVVPY